MSQAVEAIESVDEEQKLTVRHVLVVIAGLLIYFAPVCLVMNTWSLFTVPVSTALHVAPAQFNLMPSFIFLSAALFSPLMGKLMDKFDLRIILSISVCCCSCGLLLASVYTEIWMFYVSGVIEGVGVVALAYLAVGTLINRWFNEHIGFLIGICAAMTGVGGALWAMIDGVIIGGYGYQAAYLFNGSMALILGLPATALLIRSYPADIGMKPFGKAQFQEVNEDGVVVEWGTSAKKAYKTAAFFLLSITFMLICGMAQVGNMFATYVYHLSDIGAAGITPESAVITASVIITCLMIAQCLMKIFLGFVADRTIIGSLIIAIAGGTLGVLMAWQGVLFNDFMIYFGSIFFGFIFAATNVLGPTIARYIFGPREYTVIFSRCTIFINIFPAFSVMILTALFQISWDLMFGFTIAVFAVIFVLAMLLVRAGKNVEQTLEPRPE